MEVVVRKLNDKAEMLFCLPILNQLYPSLKKDEYSLQLDEMLPHNYFQVGAFNGDECIGISGVWIGNKLWCGKYLEVDHLVIKEGFRSNGVGSLILNYLKQLAKEENCASIGLDSFTHNHESHKFFFKQGFEIKGYHFVHVMDKTKMR